MSSSSILPRQAASPSAVPMPSEPPRKERPMCSSSSSSRGSCLKCTMSVFSKAFALVSVARIVVLKVSANGPAGIAFRLLVSPQLPIRRMLRLLRSQRLPNRHSTPRLTQLRRQSSKAWVIAPTIPPRDASPQTSVPAAPRPLPSGMKRSRASLVHAPATSKTYALASAVRTVVLRVSANGPAGIASRRLASRLIRR